MKKLRVGVVGLGMGAGHVKGFQQHPQAEVVAVADTDPARLQQKADELGVKGRYADLDAMLASEKLDVVAIATPNKFHKPLTIKAFKAGCHVLCEKPMAMNAAEGREMLAAAKQAKRRLMINFSFRFTDQSWALKREVETGLLGEIYFGRTVWLRRRGMPGFGGWFGQKALSGGGPVIDLGVHRLDLALWLMGYPRPTWVLASTYDHLAKAKAAKEKKAFDVEDLGVALIKFANGATLELEASWAGNIERNEEMHTRLLGTQGGLVQQNIGEGYQFEAAIHLERDGRLYDMKLHPPVPGVRGAMYHFIDSIVAGTPHTATGEEGLIVMELLDAIYASARKGAPVRIK
jgi:predicted dehydrogenase